MTGSYGPSFTIGGVDVNVRRHGLRVLASLPTTASCGACPSVLDLPEGNRPLDPVAILKVEDTKGERDLRRRNERRT